ncbi:AMP-binding protein [Clostridium saccharobutylicum]|uniref:Mycosubtilin synthase subunit B n=1 Tax=Clostridium saccharobutylicum DSM 13864 TaxID=1345695 RepID=U5MPJ0_CLOSA|nr:AMP-binding protein [Clostridium saccharobutylicum]AGX41362.1 mycosubtilin synthase subunit B [Clostridium saccharobutylicum DSM 13864]AQR88645.1 plipastatin synthase subunit E [Clostridium saccharobutylicum]AQR98543.1 plipastatin synthase subunit E [Clostridium saccharobutylicum]AQS12533.1 plipastatin synthase subunit E [Clostridium saccharobutylicum]MBA2905551.1 acyl-coenzyme A synthetase/AMP-(fatty) acid ligase/GTP:adenosylcobinamide-phosphate guanylyltransferase [Clostridium saccharobut
MIAIILAAGKGSRLASFYSCSSKCMLPFQGKPLLERTLYRLSHCNELEKIYIVIRTQEEEIPAYFGSNYCSIPIEYCVQNSEYPGIINAVYSVKDLTKYTNEDIIINLGDEYFEELDFNSVIKEHKVKKSLVTPVVVYSDDTEEIKSNYTVNITETGEIIDAIEKPLSIFNNYVGTGILIVCGKLLQDFALKCNYKFEEKQLVDWMKFAMHTNGHCYVYKSGTRFCNLNNQKNMEYLYTLSYKETSKTIEDMFSKVVESYPDRIAVRYEGQSITFKELDEKSNSFASNILQEDFKHGDCVALMFTRSIEQIIAFIGVLKAGGYYLMLDENFSKKTIEYMVEKANIKLLISNNGLAIKIGLRNRIIDFAALVKRQEKLVELPEHFCDKVFILCTSGYEGLRKGAIINKNSVVNLVISMKESVFDACKKEHLDVGVCASVSVNSSIQQIYTSLLYGHTLHIIPTTVKSRPEHLIFYLNQVDVCDITPSMISLITKHIRIHPETAIYTRHLISSGEELKKATIHSFFQQCTSTTVTNVYGLAECTVQSMMFHINEGIEQGLKRIPIGKPIRNTRVYLLDSDKRIISPGKIGDIWIAGDGISLGYLQDVELTNSRFDTDIINRNKKMYKTGDVGYLDLDGNMYYYGRVDTKMKFK